MTIEQEIALLTKRGLDPEFHSLDGRKIIKHDRKIRSVAKPEPAAEPLSQFDALTATLRRSAPTSLGGLAATGGALVGGASVLPAIGVGLGGAYLASQIDQFFDPIDEAESARLSQARTEFPKTSLAAEVLPELAFLKPGAGVVHATKAGLNAMRAGVTASTVQKAAALNVGVGGVIGAGVEGAFQAHEGEFDGGRLALAGAAGALFNDPTALGRKFGFPEISGEVAKIVNKAGASADTGPSTGVNQQLQLPAPKEVLQLTEGKQVEFGTGPIIQQELDVPVVNRQDPIELEAKAREVVTGQTVSRQELAEEIGAKSRAADAKAASESQAIADDLKASFAGRVFKDTKGPEEFVEEFGDSNRDPRTNLFVSKSRAKEHIPKDVKRPLTEGEIIQAEYDGVKYQTRDDLQSVKVQNRLVDLGIDPDLHQGTTTRTMLDTVAERRGVTTQDGKLPPDKLGMVHVKDRLATIDPDNLDTGVDVILHETAHVWLRDLQEHGSKFEKKLVAQGEKAFGSEEALVQGIGLRGTENVVKADSVREFLGDFWSHVKVRFGSGDEKALNRVLSRKIVDDAHFSDTFKPKIDAATAAKEINNTPNQSAGVEFQDANSAAIHNAAVELPSDRRLLDNIPGMGFLRGMVDHVKRLDGPLGEAFEKRALLQSRYTGAFVNKFMGLVEASGKMLGGKRWTQEEFNRVKKFRALSYDGIDTDITLTPRELALSEAVADNYEKVRKFQNDSDLKVQDGDGWRKGKFNRNYEPSILSPEAAAALRDASSSEREGIIEAIAQHWWKKHDSSKPQFKDYTLEKFRVDAENFAKVLNNTRGVPSTEKFKALRQSKGLGLPWSVVEQDGAASMLRYGNRSAKDLAYHNAIESDVDIRSKLDVPDQFNSRDNNHKPKVPLGGDKRVQDVMEYIERSDIPNEILQSFNKTLVSAFLGPMSVARDIVSSYVQSLPYMGVADIPVFLRALGNVREGWKISHDMGVNRSNVIDMEFANNATNGVANTLNVTAKWLSKLQLRNFGERFSRANTFAIGKMIAAGKLGTAKAGDSNSIKFLNHFGKGTGKDAATLVKQGGLSESDLNEMAAAFVERVQGTYDERMLPAFAQGVGGGKMLQPFFALSRWGIEKSNVIAKDIIEPVINGDPGATTRLLTYGLGAMVGGEVINQISELLTSKKSQTPGLIEASKSEFSSTDDAVRAVVQSLQYAGAGGIAMDLFRAPVEGMLAGNGTQGFSYPTAQFIAESMWGNIRDAGLAIQQGEPRLDTILKMFIKIANDNVQSVRIINNHLSTEETARKNRMRDERVFNQQTGRPTHLLGGSKPNPFLNQKAKEFKRSQDPKAVGKLAAAAIKDAVKKAGGDQQQLVNRLRGLKVMGQDGLPNPDTDPRAFAQFLRFIETTQGKQARLELLKFWGKNKSMNEFKKSLVPNTQF